MDPNNMKFRLEDLTVESVLEDCGISSDEAKEIPPNIVKMFVEDFIPTEEDIRQPMDEEQLKELCLRLPCRVLMYRWNPVHDYARQFEREGRIQRWRPEKRLKILAKAVNRYKTESAYAEDEIRPQREREWCERKKENLMRLGLWEYDRKNLTRQSHERERQLEASAPVEVDGNIKESNSSNVARYHQQQRMASSPIDVDGNREAPTSSNVARYRVQQHIAMDTVQEDDSEPDDSEPENNLNAQYSNTPPALHTSALQTAISFNNQPYIMTQVHALPQKRAETSSESNSVYSVEDSRSQISVTSTILDADLLIRRKHQICNNEQNATGDDEEVLPDLLRKQLDDMFMDSGASQEVVQTQPSEFQLLTQEEAPHYTVDVLIAPAAGDVNDLVNINTESLSITETPLASEDVYSRENTPPYNEFDNHISLTSTQTPELSK